VPTAEMTAHLCPATRFTNSFCFSGWFRARIVWVLTVIAIGISVESPRAVAQSKAATTTTLAVTYGTSVLYTVPAGTKMTLTAAVSAGATPLNPGQVNICEASAPACTDIHILATAQLTTAGRAVVNLRPAPGVHNFKAVFLGTKTYASSSSSTFVLTVTSAPPPNPTTTVINKTTTNFGAYELTGSVTGGRQSNSAERDDIVS
jgi:hypothetical protein